MWIVAESKVNYQLSTIFGNCLPIIFFQQRNLMAWSDSSAWYGRCDASSHNMSMDNYINFYHKSRKASTLLKDGRRRKCRNPPSMPLMKPRVIHTAPDAPEFHVLFSGTCRRLTFTFSHSDGFDNLHLFEGVFIHRFHGLLYFILRLTFHVIRICEVPLCSRRDGIVLSIVDHLTHCVGVIGEVSFLEVWLRQYCRRSLMRAIKEFFRFTSTSEEESCSSFFITEI